MKQKHCCRFCYKSFPSGRSLGGHMRSHMSSSGSGAGQEKMEREKRKKTSCSINIGESYSLRVNPKKTRRLYDSPGVCRPGRTRQGQCSMSSSASEAEQEQEDGAVSLMMLSMDAGSWSGGVDSCDNKSSVAKGTELDGSRDGCLEILGNRSPVVCSHGEDMGTEFGKRMAECESSTEEASKKSSELNLETLSWRKKREPGFNIDGAGKRVRDVADGGVVSKKNKYECATCNKTFHSHQALGGHRTSHKRLKERLDNSTNKVVSTSVMMNEEDVRTCELERPVDEAAVACECSDLDTRSKSYECPICFDVCSSDQALGDHKRSHLSTDLDVTTTDQASPIHDLLDLNLPAPIDEDAFKSWWIGSSNKHGTLAGLISN